jgi:phosphotransferase system enzyme I (PtsI)
MIAQDSKLSAGVESRITNSHMNAAWALDETVAEIAAAFSKIEDPYIRESIQEVYLVADRVLEQLSGYQRYRVPLPEQTALLTHDLSPTDTLELSPERMLCLVTERGGKASHTGIIARGLGLPCVVGVMSLEASVPDGTTIIVDGLKGIILVNPDEAEIEEYSTLSAQFNTYYERIQAASGLPAETTDGFKIKVQANATWQADILDVVKNGGEGVGLYRTEFTFLNRATPPDEEELHQEYLRAMISVPNEVCFRTLDVGADKILPDLSYQVEANPALGLRGIRYCLTNPELLKLQLRAMLRAGVGGRASIMFPMLSDPLEFKRAVRILQEARRELKAQGLTYAEDIPVGVMIELPAAAIMSGILAEEADFFSIGTNDLIQYTLAVDRNNHQVDHLYQPLHPAVLYAIKQVVESGHRAGIPVGVCGEMAADPYCLPMLLGLGVDSLSVNAIAVPGIKNIIRHLSRQDCIALAEEALACRTPGHVNRLTRRFMHARVSEDLAFHTSLLDIEEQSG